MISVVVVVVVESFSGRSCCGELAVCVAVGVRLPDPNVSKMARLYQNLGFTKERTLECLTFS